jgi:hypothetical protein
VFPEREERNVIHDPFGSSPVHSPGENVAVKHAKVKRNLFISTGIHLTTENSDDSRLKQILTNLEIGLEFVLA